MIKSPRSDFLHDSPLNLRNFLVMFTLVLNQEEEQAPNP